MKSSTLSINSVTPYYLLAAIAIVLISETVGPMVFKNIFILSNISIILILRMVELMLMILIMFHSQLKLELSTFNSKKDQFNCRLWSLKFLFFNILNRLLNLQHIKEGIKIGFLWSLYFAVVAFIGRILILFITQTDPILLFKSPMISEIKQSGAFEVMLFLFTACIVSSLTEELFFRGFIYAFARRYGVLCATISSTLIFTVCHNIEKNRIITLIPLIGGIVFALSYEYSKSLAAPIIIHILGNTAIFTLALLN